MAYTDFLNTLFPKTSVPGPMKDNLPSGHTGAYSFGFDTTGQEDAYAATLDPFASADYYDSLYDQRFKQQKNQLNTIIDNMGEKFSKKIENLSHADQKIKMAEFTNWRNAFANVGSFQELEEKGIQLGNFGKLINDPNLPMLEQKYKSFGDAYEKGSKSPGWENTYRINANGTPLPFTNKQYYDQVIYNEGVDKIDTGFYQIGPEDLMKEAFSSMKDAGVYEGPGSGKLSGYDIKTNQGSLKNFVDNYQRHLSPGALNALTSEAYKNIGGPARLQEINNENITDEEKNKKFSNLLEGEKKNLLNTWAKFRGDLKLDTPKGSSGSGSDGVGINLAAASLISSEGHKQFFTADKDAKGNEKPISADELKNRLRVNPNIDNTLIDAIYDASNLNLKEIKTYFASVGNYSLDLMTNWFTRSEDREKLTHEERPMIESDIGLWDTPSPQSEYRKDDFATTEEYSTWLNKDITSLDHKPFRTFTNNTKPENFLLVAQDNKTTGNRKLGDIAIPEAIFLDPKYRNDMKVVKIDDEIDGKRSTKTYLTVYAFGVFDPNTREKIDNSNVKDKFIYEWNIDQDRSDHIDKKEPWDRLIHEHDLGDSIDQKNVYRMRIMIPVKDEKAIADSIQLWNNKEIKSGDFDPGIFSETNFQGTGSDLIPIGQSGQNIIQP